MYNDFVLFVTENTPWFWFALVILFTLIEVFTLGLTTVWFAIGALVLVFLSFTGIPFVYQVFIFMFISSALLVFTRPLAVKKLRLGKEKTNVDSVIGRKAIVIKKITEFDRGEIKTDGKIWTARTESGGELGEGQECIVVRIEGVTAVVSPFGAQETKKEGV